MAKKEEKLFQNRMARHMEELRWLYMELYHNESMFAELCQKLYEFDRDRPAALKSVIWKGKRIRSGTSPMPLQG